MGKRHAAISAKPSEKSEGFGTQALADPRSMIDAVLRVAGPPLPKTDPDQIYLLLDRFAFGGRIARLKETGPRAAAILSCDLLGHENDKGEFVEGLVGKLDAIVKSADSARRRYAASVNAALSEKGVSLVAIPRFQDGRIQTSLQVMGYGVESIYAAALAILLDRTLLIDKNRTYGEALLKCALPTCREFFLSFTGAAGGRPSLYHSEFCKQMHYKIRRATRPRGEGQA